MNKQIIEGQWESIKGQLKQAWGKLTDDDLLILKGDAQELKGQLQKHYGYSEEEAKKAAHKFWDALESSDEQ